MKTLGTIQKTFRVFMDLAKAVAILSFIAAGLVLLAAGCGLVWRSGGRVIGLQMESMLSMTGAVGMDQMIGLMLADGVYALTNGVLFWMAHLYLKHEQADGTPFTMDGANRLKRLGIHMIVLPLVAEIATEVVHACFGMNRQGAWCDGFVLLGIVLILTSMVLRYGAELERMRA